jgi:hypothetical protein
MMFLNDWLSHRVPNRRAAREPSTTSKSNRTDALRRPG